MRWILTFLIIAVTVPAFAGEEAIITADGGISFNTGNYPVRAEGPRMIDIATNGDAAITFIWLLPADRDSVVKVDPAGLYGESSFALRSALPPRAFEFYGTAPDSAYVNVDTADEVIVTW